MRLFDERELRIEGAKKIAAEMSFLADEKAKTFAVEYERARMDARHALALQKNEIEREYQASLEKAKLSARDKLAVAESELNEQEIEIRADLERKTDSIASDMVQAMVRPAV